MTITAVQIARVLGRTSRGVRKALAETKPHGVAIVQGKITAAWNLEQLPGGLKVALEEMALKRCLPNAEQLFADLHNAWKPNIGDKTVTLSEIVPYCLEEARKLQRALSGALKLVVEKQQPRIEIETQGLRDYRTVFGHGISASHWWRLVYRTLKRDGGQKDFDRLELFLAEKLARKETRLVGYSAAAATLDTLQRWVQQVKTLSAPTSNEAKMVWDAAFQEIETLVDTGLVEHQAKHTVFDALQKCGVTLARNPGALRRNFDRKFQRWLAGNSKPSAINDQRSEKSGHHRSPSLSEDDRKTLIARAVENGGRIAQGWRTTVRRNELSLETAQRFIHNPAQKSYVPRAVRKAITQDVRLLKNIHHGPRVAHLKGAYITRDYSDCAAADWYQGDDVTLNHYYWEDTPAGITAMRGQCLLFIDVRSNYILGFALHSERNYTARIIRESLLRIHDTYGLPRQGFYFERGIWKNSRLLTGDQHGTELPLAVTEEGLREFVRFRHAKTARAKVIERIIGLIQNESEALPGYVGRNEITDRYERIQEKLAQARLGKIPYQSFLLSKENWVRQLEQIFDRYNEETQTGKLAGRSPLATWEKFFNYSDPLMKLPVHLRYLLANHRKPLRVTRNGIRLNCKGKSYWFRNEATGQFVGQDVLAWFQTEEEVPVSITITDLKRNNPIEVPREIQPLSMTADDETLNMASAQADSHNAYAKTLYRVIQPRFTRQGMFRQIFADERAVATGQAITADREKILAERNSKISAWRGIRRHERARNLSPAAMTRDPKAKLRGFENLRRADELDGSQTKENNHV